MSEQDDLKVMIDETQKIQLSTYNFMKYCLSMKEDDLKHSGFKTIPDALMYAMNDSEKRIKKLVKEFETKYPD